MNAKTAVFAASLIANAQRKVIWKDSPSVLVSGTGVCSTGTNAEDAGVVTFNERGRVVAKYGIVQAKTNDVPIDAEYPLPPVIQNVPWPTGSPVLQKTVAMFLQDYCYSSADAPDKWFTRRSRQALSVSLWVMKTPFGRYVASNGMAAVCSIASLTGGGAAFFDEQSRGTFTERIVGRSATVLWRYKDLFGGAVLYKEDDQWKIDFAYHRSLPGEFSADFR
jgi:hypothetical protein